MTTKEPVGMIPVSVRFDSATKKALEKAAKDDARTVSGLIQKLVMEHLKERKYIK
jgi:hypothetical protein